ncbi:MAG: flippase-like domain-containing protein [Bacteroidetes bacterium]|nr:flippase-like domain-containing protein [Bacteroidota bacterium]
MEPPKIKYRIGARDLAGYGISGLLLWYTFHQSGLRLADIRMSGLQWVYFAAAVAVFVFSLWLYGVRARVVWAGEIAAGRPISTYGSFILGNFYNCLLPGNLGEAVRALHFSRKNGITFSRSLAATVTEKWLDAQVFAILVLLLFLVKPFAPDIVSYALVYTALAVLVLTCIHQLMLRYKGIEKGLWAIALRLGRAGRFLYRLYYHTDQHLRTMHRYKAVQTYILFFFLIFGLNVLQFLLLEYAAGVSSPVAGIYSSYLVALSMMIIAFIPSAPSNIGVLHYGVYSAMIFAGRQYGTGEVPQSLEAYALFSVYAHLSFLIPEIAIGTWYLIRERQFLF